LLAQFELNCCYAPEKELIQATVTSVTDVGNTNNSFICLFQTV